MKKMKFKQRKYKVAVFLALLISSVSVTLTSTIYGVSIDKNFGLEDLALRTSDDPWYESNENYAIGDFPINEWDPYDGSENKIDVVMASTHNVDMTGKVIKLKSSLFVGTGMERLEIFTINTGQSLYLSFKAQLNKEYPDSEAKATILLVGQSGLTFLEIIFNSLYESIDIRIAGGQEMEFNNLILNQVYDFDIFFIKDPTTNEMKYLIFIDQQLEFLTKVDTALYPIAAYIELAVLSDSTEEFFIDNFFLGRVDNDISLKGFVTTAYPIYYLYHPEYLSDPDDHVNSMSIKYIYDHIYDQELSFSLNLGFTVGGEIGGAKNIPIGDVIPLSGGPTEYHYEVATTSEDVIIFYKIDADVRNITFYLPGIDPDSGVSEIKGMYEYSFLAEYITSSTIAPFVELFGSLPQDYEDCKRSGNAQIFDHRTIKAKSYGNLTRFYDINQVFLDYSWVSSWGISVNIPKTPFNFGINFITTCENTYDARVSLGIDWDSGTDYDTKIQYDLYAPPEGTYSTSLDIAPYSVQQVVYHAPIKVTGLTATPGLRRIDLSWTANPESDNDYYKIYRNGVQIATTTTTSYANTGLPDSTTYTYRVSAVNIYSEEGAQSDPKQATTNPPSPGFTESILIITLAIGLTIVLFRFNAKLKKPIQSK